MNPQSFLTYSALIGLSIPAGATIISIIDTVLEKNKRKNETTPTILTSKLSDSIDKKNDIPKEVLPYLKLTNSQSSFTQSTSNSSSNTPTNSDKKKNITSEIGER